MQHLRAPGLLLDRWAPFRTAELLPDHWVTFRTAGPLPHRWAPSTPLDPVPDRWAPFLTPGPGDSYRIPLSSLSSSLIMVALNTPCVQSLSNINFFLSVI